MKVSKKVIGNLEKCYSVAPLTYKGKKHMLVAAEKVNQCRLYDLEGNQEEVIWEGPGGTMSMVQVPGSDGQFLATHKFYSPNDSKEAKIILAYPEDLSTVDEEHPLQFEVLKEGLLKNHGYCKAEVDGVLRSYVAANEGVFECTPPESAEGTWEIKQVLDEASSDMAFTADLLDSDVGPANVLHYTNNGEDYILSANREIDEIALYKVEK